jgi:predicted nucleic acid-binding protein
MDVILLDTNVIALLFKGDGRAQSCASRLWGRKLALSFITVAELFQWTAVRNWDQPKIDRLGQHLQSYVILPFDADLCRQWGEIRAQCRAAGHPISPQDAWVAATALRYHLPLVTQNPGAFKIVRGLELIAVD